jgi:hypothetical protein
MGVVVRGVDDTGVVPVVAVVEPDMLRDDIGGGMSTDGVKGVSGRWRMGWRGRRTH